MRWLARARRPEKRGGSNSEMMAITANAIISSSFLVFASWQRANSPHTISLPRGTGT